MGATLSLKRCGKSILGISEKILPSSSHRAFSTFIFETYRITARILYKMCAHIPARFFDPKLNKMVSRIHEVMPYTLVGVKGLEATYTVGEQLNEKQISGCFVELGVARGGCSALMGTLAFESDGTTRELWLFDSFEGLPDPTEEDFVDGSTGQHVRSLPKGSCLGTLEEVQDLILIKRKFPKESVHFVQGWFQDTLPDAREKVGPIALLRIDGDWYDSTMCCLENLYDQVVDGGAIVIDDYESCYGCKRAVDEFLTARNLSPQIRLDGRGGCYFWK